MCPSPVAYKFPILAGPRKMPSKPGSRCAPNGPVATPPSGEWDKMLVLRMRGAIPNARSVLALLASAALQRNAYNTPIHQLKQASAFNWI